jgi:hypothetical protein
MNETRLNRSHFWVLLLIAIINSVVIVGEVRAAAWLKGESAADHQPYAQTTPPPTPEFERISPYYAVSQQTQPDGKVLVVDIIGGPPNPPSGNEVQRAASNFTRDDAVLLPDFPSYNWVFGCSAVSGAMIAGYYDNQGYPNMYTGPANGGEMPITDTVWPTWQDGTTYTYPSNPLVASKDGLDGYSGYGSIEDYWVSYNSNDQDPYIDNWEPHTWGSAIGDFMKTSQSNYNNLDGFSTFWNRVDATKLYCSDMPDYVKYNDATYGRKLFYEARGYSVVECYNQRTDNKATGGFSFLEYKSEIDNGHPVFLNLEGHSVVGFGYSGTTVYLRDTWDSDPNHYYIMPWGGNYEGMELLSVGIVQLLTSNPPGAFGKIDPANEVINVSLSPTLNWSTSSGADSYDYCYSTSWDGCNDSWINNGLSTSVTLSDLSPNTAYFWHVQANNIFGEKYAEGSDTGFWQFTTGDPPGPFAKSSPADGSTDVLLSPNLNWESSSGADRYEYCVDTTDNDQCDNNWQDNGANVEIDLDGLSFGTTYFWQVRAVNDIGTSYAENSETTWWQFTTGSLPGVFEKSSPLAGQGDLPLNTSLSWSEASGADSYEYCYDMTDNEACDSSWVNNGSNTSVELSGLSPGSTYYWHVRAVNPFGETLAEDGYWSFTTVPPPPDAFGKSAPEDQATLVGLHPTLSWTASDWVESYEYCYDTTDNDACDSDWVNNGASTFVELSGLTPWMTYYWQVRAVNISGSVSADGWDFWQFETGNPPGDFAKLSPENSLVGVSNPTTLSWSSSSTAERYEVCLQTSTSGNCEWVDNGSSTVRVLDGLEVGAQYDWQVRAVNDIGTAYADSVESHFWSFTTRFLLNFPIIFKH